MARLGPIAVVGGGGLACWRERVLGSEEQRTLSRGLQMNQLVMSVLWLAGLGLAVPPEYSYGLYNEGRMDPQLEGWPLTAEERAYVVERAEHNRRPGRESLKHLPKLWPVVPAAGHWGGASRLKTHEKLVRHVQSHAGPCDVLLVGDSITLQWGSVLDGGSLKSAWRDCSRR